jgi:hypothetical protein
VERRGVGGEQWRDGSGQKNGDNARLEMSWDDGLEVGQKASRAGINLAGAGEKKKENIASFRLCQINSRAKTDRRRGMAAEIDFELIQGVLEFKSKGLNIFKPNLN